MKPIQVPPKELDRLRERERFLSAIREGLADAEAGRMIEDDELERELDQEYGPSTGGGQ